MINRKLVRQLIAATAAVATASWAAQPPSSEANAAADPGLGAGVQPVNTDQQIVHPSSIAHLPSGWIVPGGEGTLPKLAQYSDSDGLVGVFNKDGPIELKNHPFFAAIGENGRGCVTCHQPANAMSLSVDAVHARWQQSKGTDPLFAMVDGADCPNLDAQNAASHSLLLQRGLIRVALPWPPRHPDGTPFEPDFSIEVVRDPTGCNTNPVYGLTSKVPMVSIYRRPRIVGNFEHVLVDFNKPIHPSFTHFRFLVKGTEEPFPIDPKTGLRENPNIMDDGRFGLLTDQASDAAVNHLGLHSLTSDQMAAILQFENQVYVAGSGSNQAGPYLASEGAPHLGPEVIPVTKPIPAQGFTHFGFTHASWTSAKDKEDPQSRFRQSVMRGFEIFNRRILISDVQNINSNGLGNPQIRSCALCHVMPMSGVDSQTGWIDVGSQNLPWAGDDPALPLFKITCKPGAPQHMFLGSVIYTHDPGRALISGRCYDVGSIVVPQLRGLSARAPYFSNGSASSLREVVDFYDRRWNLRYTDQDKEDLINFMSVL